MQLLKHFSLLVVIIIVFFDLSHPQKLELSSSINYHYNSISYYDDYLIIIPKIALKISFSSHTTLDEGLEIHEVSQKENAPLVISGHTGIGANALFNDLFSLNVGDEIIIINGSKKYTYVIDYIKDFQKQSKLKIFNSNKYLYLVTCDKYNMKKQWIFSSKLAKIEEI